MAANQNQFCNAPGCIGAELFADELFCPWCGTLRPLVSAVIQVMRAGSWEDLEKPLPEKDHSPLQIKIVNLSHKLCLRFDSGRIESTQPWLTPNQTAQIHTLGPGAVVTVPLSYQIPAVTGATVTASLRLRVSPCDSMGNLLSYFKKEYQVNLLLTVQGVAKFHCALASEQSEYVIAKGKEALIPFILWIDSCPVQLLSLNATSDDVSLEQLYLLDANGSPTATSVALPQELIPRGFAHPQALRAQLRIKSSAADRFRGLQRLELRAKYRNSLSSAEQEPESVTALVLEVPFRRQPQMNLDIFDSSGFYRWHTVCGQKPLPLSVTVENCGDQDSQLCIWGCFVEPLTSELLGVGPTVTSLPAAISVEMSAPSGAKAQPFPLTVKYGEPLTMRLHLQGPLEAGTHVYKLGFVTNETDQNSARQVNSSFTLHVKAEAPRAWNGCLAVDLGTSSSCAALIGAELAGPVLTVLDEANKGDSQCLRSVLEYRKLAPSLNGSNILAGYYAWLGYFARPYSAVMAPKHDLGKVFAYDITPAEDLHSLAHITPQEAVQHLYGTIAKAVKNAIINGKVPGVASDACQLNCFVISHPSRFSFRQIEMLSTAAKQAFGEVFAVKPEEMQLSLIDEPVAAALSYLSKETTHQYWHEKNTANEVVYTILVYDCGGGTTDLSLLEVQSKRTLVKSSRIAPQSLRDACIAKRWPQYVQSALSRLETKYQAESKTINYGQYGDLQGLIEHITKADWVSKSGHLQLERYPFPFFDISQAILNEASSEWHYSVRVKMLGANGDPLFGGEEMTGVVHRLLVERASQALANDPQFGPSYHIIAETPGQTGHYAEAARRNWRCLYYWAETIKCSLSRAKALGEVWHIPNSSAKAGSAQEAVTPLQVSDGTNYREIHLLDLLNGSMPSLEEIEAKLFSRFMDTYQACQSLIDECLSPSQLPDLLLLTGRASSWPQIAAELQVHFPQVRLVVPQLATKQETKHCVVDGAARWFFCSQNGGESLDVPGVFIDLTTGVNSLPSRLGVAVTPSGGPRFRQIIGAGRPFENGLASGTISWVLPRSAHQQLRIYENSGVTDLFAEANGCIAELCCCEYEVPDNRRGESALLTLQVDAQSLITVSLKSGDWFWSSQPMKAAIGSGY